MLMASPSFCSPFLLLCSDGRRAHVRRRARGGRGCAAVSADHRQLITVQPAQALALREPLHGPHQRGIGPGTCPRPTLILPLSLTHSKSRRRRNMNKALAEERKVRAYE